MVTGMACPPPEVIASLDEGEQARMLEALMQHQREVEASLRSADLWPRMGGSEQKIIRKPTEMTPQTMVDISWMAESEECLLWALGLIDGIPPWDTQADVEHLKKLPEGTIAELMTSAELRPAEEISEQREIAELWHWRSRTRKLQEGSSPVELPDGLTFSEIVRMSAERAESDGLFISIDGDFPAFGRAYSSISPEEWSIATSIAMERHKALNWLCGFAPGNRWDETPTDT